ncbi:MarR family winged helix-turn-helix transcriptional regulator [Falsiporphyromonas endometrii]|uniref:MarR family winged helix-turn-helix transcriptional regulator n=1 Tax=Falsiporphyromonas endometrii TaxID=1387297 RepID=A0ABV9KAW2_9PORP
MNKTELLKLLVEEVDAYDAIVGGGAYLSPQAFAAYLNVSKRSRDESGERASDDMLNSKIASSLGLLYRFIHSYIKRAFINTKVQTLEDCTYLMTLHRGEVMTKTQLNNANAMEKTSGAEVIRRLNKAGLVEQKESPVDRRSMDVSITKEGKEELKKVLPHLFACASILTAGLSKEQKEILCDLQTTLCNHNKDLFSQYKDLNLVELCEIIGIEYTGNKPFGHPGSAEGSHHEG